MDSFTRRSFVESLGVTLGLGSIASAAEGQLSTSDIPAPDTPPDPKGLRFRLVHLDFIPPPSSPMWQWTSMRGSSPARQCEDRTPDRQGALAQS